jgi:amidohydrolase
MANLLGLARLVCNRRARVPSNRVLRLLWQPAEEGPGGAKPMVEEGAMEGVDEVYGFHNWPTFPLGSVHVAAGPVMAHVTDFDITVRGRGGHASTPHVLADPVVAASHCVVAAQTVVSRSVYAGDAAVISFSTIHGGETRNVIPSDVTMSGTIRDLSPDASAVIYERFPAVIKATAEAHGCAADVEVRSVYPILRNHDGPASHCGRVGRAVLGETRVSSWGLPLMGGEDFGYFSEAAGAGCYVFFGTAEEGERRGVLSTSRNTAPAASAAVLALPLWLLRCMLASPCADGIASASFLLLPRHVVAAGRENHMLHSSHYDFNDKVLPRTITFFLRLLEDRWGLSPSASASASASASSAASQLYTDAELPGFADAEGVPSAEFRTAPPKTDATPYTPDVSADASAMGRAV